MHGDTSDNRPFDPDIASEWEFTAPLTTPRPYDENDIEQVRERLMVAEFLLSQQDERMARVTEDREQRRGILTELQLEVSRLRRENEELRKRLGEL